MGSARGRAGRRHEIWWRAEVAFVTDSDLGEQLAGIAALADPIRRDLYRYVSAQPVPVSRDQAADALAIARHTAKFHLDKLAEEGLLDTSFKRLSDRRGPGAGRPTKLYARSSRQLSVTLPGRRYDLAGHLLASAIDNAASEGNSAAEALTAAATRVGTSPWRPSPSSRRSSAEPRTAGRCHLSNAGRVRVRATPRRRHRRPVQLPLPYARPGTYISRLWDEPRDHGRSHRPSRQERACCPARPRT